MRYKVLVIAGKNTHPFADSQSAIITGFEMAVPTNVCTNSGPIEKLLIIDINLIIIARTI